ncbi:WYL domain-containing protein [Nocardia sp. NPDC020380]|uniref:WYL domain-containing protein n=1 Tax=Nocardia sp. NPDC020380 TaxID=3364309 RepID=UPI003793E710
MWRTINPIGLVTVRDMGYLLATKSGSDRTYRLSRIRAAEQLAEPAQRPDRVDLDRAWHERSTQFRTSGDHVTVLVRVNPARREELLLLGGEIVYREDTMAVVHTPRGVISMIRTPAAQKVASSSSSAQFSEMRASSAIAICSILRWPAIP